MNGTNRLGLLTRDELDEDGKAFHDFEKNYTNTKYKNVGAQYELPDGRLIGPFGIMLHTPAIGHGFFQLNAAINEAAAGLDKTVREIAINTVSSSTKAAYESYAHQILAKRAGVTDEQIAEIEAERKPKTLNEKEGVAWDVATELCVRPGAPLSNGTWERAVSLLGKRSAIGLVHLVGFYQYVSTILNGFDARTPDGKAWNKDEGKWTL